MVWILRPQKWIRLCVVCSNLSWPSNCNKTLKTVNRAWGILDDFANAPFHKETVFGFHIVGTFTLLSTLFNVTWLQCWIQSKWEYKKKKKKFFWEGGGRGCGVGASSSLGTSPRFIEKPFIVSLSSYLFSFLGFKRWSLFILNATKIKLLQWNNIHLEFKFGSNRSKCSWTT